MRWAAFQVLERQKDLLLNQYWDAGNVPEENRIAQRMCMNWAEDFFEASAEDFNAVMKED